MTQPFNMSLVAELKGTKDKPQWSLLIVDDERNIRASLSRLFLPLGYQIHVAESGFEGLEILSEHRVDLIISDVRMPEMNGAEFVTEVAQRYPDTVRILLTGYADLSSTVTAINEGKIYRYISKPWEDTEITLAVQQALQTKRLEWEKKQLLHLFRQKNAELKDRNENLEQNVRAHTEEIKQTADMLDLAYQQLKDSYEGVSGVLCSLIRLRTSLSGSHAQKIAELARLMAKQLELDNDQINDIYYAGLLHELGKLGLPDALLELPLNNCSHKSEELYQQYPLLGQSVLTPIKALHGSAALIATHEEHFDGSGFPHGLSGVHIPLGARILSIAKNLYAYRTGKDVDEKFNAQSGFARIESFSGTLYDPQLVDLLRVIIQNQSAKGVAKIYCIGTNELLPGMKLCRDIYNHENILLLSKDRVLSEKLISKLRAIENQEKQPFEFFVYETKGQKL